MIKYLFTLYGIVICTGIIKAEKPGIVTVSTTITSISEDSGQIKNVKFAAKRGINPLDTMQKSKQRKAKKGPDNHQKDYSKYTNIFDLIRCEIPNVKVKGTNVYTPLGMSFSLSSQVLYDVDGMIVSDISFVVPVEVEKIEYIDDIAASQYGVRGANGVIKITLRKQ